MPTDYIIYNILISDVSISDVAIQVQECNSFQHVVVMIEIKLNRQ